jgi:hypothetical protein
MVEFCHSYLCPCTVHRRSNCPWPSGCHQSPCRGGASHKYLPGGHNCQPSRYLQNMAPEHTTGFLPMRSLLPACPSVPPHELPRVCLLLPPTAGCPWLPVSSWSPPPRPAASTLSSPTPVLPCFQTTPQQLDFSNVPSPRVVSKPQAPSPRVVTEPWHLTSLHPPVLPTCKLISHRTRSHAPAPLALFTAGQLLHKCVTYHIPTAKSVWATAEPIGFAGLYKVMQPADIDRFAYLCQALMQLSSLEALLVLNTSKATWDTSYANEIGRLCQDIGTGPSPNTKWVAGINTFFLINYHDILCHKRKEICHTLVVCQVHPEKDDPDCTRITIGGSHICFPGNVGTNIASLELVKLLLNSVLSCPGALLSSINLKNFYLDTPMPESKYIRIRITDIPVEFIEEYNL